MKSNANAAAETIPVAPKYYEVDGCFEGECQQGMASRISDRPNSSTRYWVRDFCAATAADGHSHRPQRRGVRHRQTRQRVDSRPPPSAGTDQFLDEAFAKRFLTTYLNYSPADVDDHWANSLNMMTRNLRAYTIKAMADDNTRGKIDDDQIESVFHLREIEPVTGEPLTYLIYGVKDVHRLSKGTESTDHFVNEYRIRLIADHRSDVNP